MCSYAVSELLLKFLGAGKGERKYTPFWKGGDIGEDKALSTEWSFVYHDSFS